MSTFIRNRSNYIIGLILFITLVTYFVNFSLGNIVLAVSSVLLLIVLYIRYQPDPFVPGPYRLLVSGGNTVLLLLVFVITPLLFTITFFSDINEVPICKVNEYGIYGRRIITEYNGRAYTARLGSTDLYRLNHGKVYPYIVKEEAYLFNRDNLIYSRILLDLIREIKNRKECINK